MLNSASQVRTVADSSTKVDDTPSAPIMPNLMLGEGFISPKVEMPKPSERNRYFSEPLMLLVGKRKYKGQYNFHRKHFSKFGYHIENYIFPDGNVLGWKLL
jgi:hypothetical protein